MDGRNYRNCRIIDTSDLRDIATEMKAIKRSKTTPELTVLQFEWAISAIEKIIKRSDLVLPVMKQVEIETRAQVFKKRKKAKAAYKAKLKKDI